MTIEKLREILPPPPRAGDAISPSEWSTVERNLGTRLPDDYKDFIALYGTGRIDNFLVIYTPWTNNQYIDLIERNRCDPEGFSQLRRDYPNLYPHDRYPTPGGLLSFGSTDNGEVLYWKTSKGRSDEWTVVTYEARGPKHFEFTGAMSDFLVAILSQQIVCDVFPRAFPSEHPNFALISDT